MVGFVQVLDGNLFLWILAFKSKDSKSVNLAPYIMQVYIYSLQPEVFNSYVWFLVKQASHNYFICQWCHKHNTSDHITLTQLCVLASFAVNGKVSSCIQSCLSLGLFETHGCYVHSFEKECYSVSFNLSYLIQKRNVCKNVVD